MKTKYQQVTRRYLRTGDFAGRLAKIHVYKYKDVPNAWSFEATLYRKDAGRWTYSGSVSNLGFHSRHAAYLAAMSEWGEFPRYPRKTFYPHRARSPFTTAHCTPS